MRGLKDRLVEELNAGGKLAWLLEEVKRNVALTMGICENYVAVYYRGALAMTVKPGGGYTFLVDQAHFITDAMKEEYNIFIRDKKAVGVYQRKFPILMSAMDEVAEKNGLTVVFPQEFVEENSCIIDPCYPIADGVTVMLVAFNGVLYAMKNASGDVAGAKAAFPNADQAAMVESAKVMMANRVALGLMAAEVPFGDTVEFTAVSRVGNKPSGVPVFVLAEGKFDLASASKE